jgi:hypothetical protein
MSHNMSKGSELTETNYQLWAIRLRCILAQKDFSKWVDSHTSLKKSTIKEYNELVAAAVEVKRVLTQSTPTPTTPDPEAEIEAAVEGETPTTSSSFSEAAKPNSTPGNSKGMLAKMDRRLEHASKTFNAAMRSCMKAEAEVVLGVGTIQGYHVVQYMQQHGDDRDPWVLWNQLKDYFTGRGEFLAEGTKEKMRQYKAKNPEAANAFFTKCQSSLRTMGAEPLPPKELRSCLMRSLSHHESYADGAHVGKAIWRSVRCHFHLSQRRMALQATPRRRSSSRDGLRLRSSPEKRRLLVVKLQFFIKFVQFRQEPPPPRL